MLDSLITSKTRIKLLVKFFSNTGNRGYLRGLADEFKESTNSVRVELNRLSEAGLLHWQNNGKTKSYQANVSHPLYQEIRSIVSKYLGFDDLIEQVVNNLGNVKKAIILGDYAEGKDSGTIELLLVGEAINSEYLAFLIQKTEEKIQRKLKVEVRDTIPAEGLSGLVVFEKESQ
ncbi:ArsR family transcriptional regulator [Cyclobacterium jeungdonense]|uniref:ArsR family transcriptional regulator n=1 Tax=Cyclobacterium jeungdonense TaxID=708087 RepID=A0ABT8CCS3_9BACT|nr:ArsR family transcriptional regulator [Cyclobacterium jeungdonense]MDN3690595.1 ArsR family transcriptional regulator [Cyclobacterium jeungdonense]